MSISLDDFVQNLQIRKAFVAVGHTWLVYDFLLTFDDEVQYIWQAPWTIVKVTYLVNRYVNLVGQTFIRLEEFDIIGHRTQSFCKKFYLASFVFMMFCVESVHVLVIMRAWAIWGCQRRVAIRLAVGYTIYIGSLIGAVTYTTKTQTFSTFHAVQNSKICFSHTPSYVWLMCVASILLDTVMFTLIMWNLWKHSRLRDRRYLSSLLHVLSRDAIIFFVIHVFTSSFTIAALVAFSADPRNFLSRAFACPLLSITGQR
ncbi:hypothetical protein BS17DRAFT_739351, partial [Gyrodon lividus]